ncbi:MAG: flippase-like domain-containing protein, partial [Myxococcales bacterium]|nr:flippase-like domain-containing protein [Myxococcales bacterium]
HDDAGAAAPASLPTVDRHLASHVFNVAVLVIGLGLLAWMVHDLGLDRARAVLRDAGGWFPLIVALDVAAMACDAAAVHAFMRPEARMVSFWRVLAAQASGRAVNILTPGGALGEATKVTMLVSHAPRARVVSAIVLADLASFYLSVTIVVLGVPLTLLIADLPHDLQVLIWIGLAVLVPLMAGLGVLVHRGAVGSLVGTLRGLRVISAARARSWRDRLAEIDGHIRELQAARSEGTRIGLVFVGASRLIAWGTLVIVLRAIDVHVTATLFVAVVSCGVLIGWIAAVVPLGLGVADGSNYALFDALGASGAHGLFMTLLNRARSLTIAVLGLVTMGVGHTLTRISLARRRRRLLAMRRRRDGEDAP